jgi:hypothetical protein
MRKHREKLFTVDVGNVHEEESVAIRMMRH